MRRPSAPVVLAAAALAVAIRVGVVLNRTIDPDESQHLHVAWRIARGEVPYRDFWEHHLPLFHYLAAPLTLALFDRPAVYFVARAVMVLAAAGVVVLTWRIARRLSPAAAVWAAVVLVFLPQFAETSTETRPDVPALLAHALGLVALVRWRGGGGARWLWAAGASQGVALALSLKATFTLAGTAAVLLAPWPAGLPAPGRLRSWLRLAGGAAIAPAALVAWLGATGGAPAVRGLVRDVLQGSLGFVDRGKTWPAFGSELGAFALAGLGLLMVLRVRGPGLLAHPVHAVVLIPALVVALALGLPWTPAVYQHAWLPVLPAVAVYAGLGIAALGEAARGGPAPWRRALAMAAILVAVVLPAGESLLFAVRNQNADQLRWMRHALALACPGEPVLDGNGLAVFRPAAHRYGALVTGVREWVARGMIAEEVIEQDLRRTRARVALPDRRLRAMIGPVATFVRGHYVPGPDGVLVAGVEIPAAPGGGRTYVDLLADGWHLLEPPAGTAVAFDTVEVPPGWVALPAGPHEVTWRGSGGTIRLVAATCPERRALPPPGGPRASGETAPARGASP